MHTTHELVHVATWADTTVDGLPFVAADFRCSCMPAGVCGRAGGGRDVAEATRNATTWHEVHARIAAGRWAPFYNRLRRPPSPAFMDDHPLLGDPGDVVLTRFALAEAGSMANELW